MLYIRTTKTASGATAVQVVRYESRKKIIVKHLGSAHTQKELRLLRHAAQAWIESTTKQSSLFITEPLSHVLPLDRWNYHGFRYGLLYEVFSEIFVRFQFHRLRNKLLTDLVIARIVEPGSKRHSLKFLEAFMGIKHHRKQFYQQLPRLTNLQDQIEAKVLAVAKEEFHFSFSFVLYDVTTLYFESFEPDELRKPGFSKDNKSQQPQILIGLLVSTEGFPVAYHIFEGNKFEGHTLIPVILAFKRKHHIGQFTVVADAAMMSVENITALRAAGLHYIVGARTGKLSLKFLADVNVRLRHQDGATVRIPTTEYGNLICEFSAKRFTKDERELNDHIRKAEALLKNPSAIKRTKFLKPVDRHTYAMHTELVEKTKLLLGLKSYYTDLGSEVGDQAVIEHYHNLWHVEQAFRIAKSDLQMRPIYHFKQEMIKAHILICFMSLAVCKYMELKTGKSTKTIITALKSITDARMTNPFTDEETLIRSHVDEQVNQLLIQMGVRY